MPRRCEEGYEINFAGDYCTAEKNNEIVLQGKEGQGVYRSERKLYSNSAAHSTVSVPGSLWHMGLGHAHIGSVRKLHSTGAVTGLHLSKTHNNSASCQKLYFRKDDQKGRKDESIPFYISRRHDP